MICQLLSKLVEAIAIVLERKLLVTVNLGTCAPVVKPVSQDSGTKEELY